MSTLKKRRKIGKAEIQAKNCFLFHIWITTILLWNFPFLLPYHVMSLQFFFCFFYRLCFSFQNFLFLARSVTHCCCCLSLEIKEDVRIFYILTRATFYYFLPPSHYGLNFYFIITVRPVSSVVYILCISRRLSHFEFRAMKVKFFFCYICMCIFYHSARFSIPNIY